MFTKFLKFQHYRTSMKSFIIYNFKYRQNSKIYDKQIQFYYFVCHFWYIHIHLLPFVMCWLNRNDLLWVISHECVYFMRLKMVFLWSVAKLKIFLKVRKFYCQFLIKIVSSKTWSQFKYKTKIGRNFTKDYWWNLDKKEKLLIILCKVFNNISNSISLIQQLYSSRQ